MAPVSVDQLVAAMKGSSQTSGWDVVVSYGVTQLNKSLDTLWAMGKMGDGVSIGPKAANGQQLDNTYEMQVHKPTMQFKWNEENKAIAFLSMGLSGKVLRGHNKNNVLAIDLGAFTIEMSVPLGTVPGGDGLTGGNTVSKPSESIVQFGDGAQSTHKIVFNFKSLPQNAWNLRTLDEFKDTNQDVAIEMMIVAGEIQDWFLRCVRDIDFSIAQVNDKEVSNAKGTILRPKAFIFTVQGQGDDAVLSIYIQTHASGRPVGQSNPKFLPNVDYWPVPSGHGASVIIDYEVMRDLFFIKNINASLGDNSASDVKSAGQDGFEFHIKSENYYEKKLNGSNFFNNYYGGEDLKGSFKDNPITLRVKDGQASWSLNFWQRNIRWQRNQHFTMPGMAGGSRGEFDANAYIDTQTQPIITSNQDLRTGSPYTMLPQVSFHLKFHAHSDPDPWSEWPWWKQLLGGKPRNEWDNSVPYEVEGYKPDLKAITVSFDGVDFLLTKNVFANAAQKDIIKIDTGRGMLTPHDVLLVGQVTS